MCVRCKLSYGTNCVYGTAFRRWSSSYGCVLIGVLARGDAKVLVMGGQDDIWDHAAGMLIAQEAGLLVTNGAGVPCLSLDTYIYIYMQC